MTILVYRRAQTPAFINLKLLQKTPAPPAGSVAAADRKRESAISHGLVAFGAVMAVVGTIITFLETFTDLLK